MAETSNNLPIKHISKAAAEELQYMKGRQDGSIKSLKTPWKKMNMATMNGLEWGSINVIGGMSGSGKTAILNELETGLFDQNPNEDFVVLSFNFEMLARRLVGRKISKKLGRSVKQLYSADFESPEYNLTREDYITAEAYCRDELSKFPIYYVDLSGNVNQIVSTITDFALNGLGRGKSIVVTLDHSLLVKQLKGQDERQALYALGAAFNDLKKKLPVIFVIVSQLNRSIESVERIENVDLHYPQKSDVFGADALYQYSDLFMITHRPEMLNIALYGPNKLPVEGYVYWHFIKTRDGEPFIGQMLNNLKHNKIVEGKNV